MRFYTNTNEHRFYCGVDLHARSMYVCVVDQAGTIVFHEDLCAEPGAFLGAIAPFRDGLVVACECLFCWYWLADLCAAEKIPFVLGHALYMKAIHGGKIARLLRGGTLPVAYVYPAGMRETEETQAPDPDNVFGAVACGHRGSKLAGVGSRERVNSQSRTTRNEAQQSSEFRGAGY